MTNHDHEQPTLTSPYMKQLHRVKSLNAGLEWVAMCPDQEAKQALIELIGEEVNAALAGVIYAAEHGRQI